MSKLSPEAQSLLRDALSHEEPASLVASLRVRQGIQAAILQTGLAQPSANLGSATPTATMAGGATGSTSVLKLASWILLGASVGVGGWRLADWLAKRETTTEQSAISVTSAATALSVGVTTAEALPAIRPGLIAENRALEMPDAGAPIPVESLPYEKEPSATRPEVGPGLEQELRLLSRVQAELRQGHGKRALELLDRHRSPPGAGQQLADERLAAEVFAACAAGDVGRARRAAEKFLSKVPGSPLAPRVRSSCGIGVR